MIKKLKDISDKIDNDRKEVLLLLNDIISEHNCEFLIVGATARDIILKYCYDLKVNYRATIDLDIAINVRSWEDFETIKKAMISRKQFIPTKVNHRLHHSGGLPIDIIPFGGVEDDSGQIMFPPDNLKMTTLGFDDTLKNAVNTMISVDPDTIVPVADLENLFVMKLISWDEKYPGRGKDATDMSLIIKYYLEGDKQNNLYEEDSDLLEEDDFDLEREGARVLGRNIARYLNQQTLNYVFQILENELNPDTEYRLALDLDRGYELSGELEPQLILIERIVSGINDISA